MGFLTAALANSGGGGNEGAPTNGSGHQSFGAKVGDALRNQYPTTGSILGALFGKSGGHSQQPNSIPSISAAPGFGNIPDYTKQQSPEQGAPFMYSNFGTGGIV